jgi:two-component system chemotaxis sensor kinase CheA
MGAKGQELLTKLLATFKVEAEEHISAISSGLVELEQTSLPQRRTEIIETVFRETHSLKGAARAVNLVKVESICQSLENTFSTLKAEEVSLASELFDQLHKQVDALSRLLSAGGVEVAKANESPLPETAGDSEASHATTVRQLGIALRAPELTSRRPTDSRAALQPMTPVTEERLGSPETVRVSRLKLDSLFRQAEELVSSKATASRRSQQLSQVAAALDLWEKQWRTIRPQVHALQRAVERSGKEMLGGQENAGSRITDVLTFFERNQSTLLSIKDQLAAVGKSIENDRRALDRKIDDLLMNVKSVSMIPAAALLDLFPKLVHDLCRDCGKDAELIIEGLQVETDRRILEELKEPLIHLVRNSIDHGIESPREREQTGKPSRATIMISISPKSGGKVEIVVRDDGAGVDTQLVAAAAVKLGAIAPSDVQGMNKRDALSLVFQSGISTSRMITEVSGRGLGLAIVREKVEKLGGTISVATEHGKGTVFELTLPVTLATFRGLLIRVGDGFFVLPTMHVQRVLRIAPDQIKTVGNRETVQLNGRIAAVVRLGEVLGIAPGNPSSDPKLKTPAVILTSAGEEMVFLVDEILADEEVIVKGLGKQLVHLRNIAGATILGTGKVVPVLNVADLTRSAVVAAPLSRVHQAAEEPKSILVADDSITARTLLKNILESAGYRVKTAVDGSEAFATLGDQAFDLVVSDVDMPRMTGFDLTAKIRADCKLSELPVVLVTGLDSREDRERGVEVGANAYIVKSSFNESNLLEVVRRMI